LTYGLVEVGRDCKIVISNAEQNIIGSRYSVRNIKETHWMWPECCSTEAGSGQQISCKLVHIIRHNILTTSNGLQHTSADGLFWKSIVSKILTGSFLRKSTSFLFWVSPKTFFLSWNNFIWHLKRQLWGGVLEIALSVH